MNLGYAHLQVSQHGVQHARQPSVALGVLVLRRVVARGLIRERGFEPSGLALVDLPPAKRRLGLLPSLRPLLHGERGVAVDVVRESGDDVEPLDRGDDRLLAERSPRDLERELPDESAADDERQVERVERLGLQPQVLQHHVALEHRDAEVLGADAVDVLAQQLVQHGRELTLEHGRRLGR